MHERDGLEAAGAERIIDDARGERLVLRPLVLTDYASAREAAKAWWVRNELQPYAANADLLYPDDPKGRRDYVEVKLRELSSVAYEDLPTKEIIEYEGDANAWMQAKEDRVVKNRHRAEFTIWWMSSVPEGVLHMLWLSARRTPSQAHMSLADVEQRFLTGDVLDETSLERAGQSLGQITGAVAGNGAAPDEGAQARKKRKNRRRKGRK